MSDNNKQSALGMVSFIVGIVACIAAASCLLSVYVGVPLGIAALIMGLIQRKKNPDDKKAKIGFTLGIVAVALGLVLFIAGWILVSSTTGIANPFSAAQEYTNMSRMLK